MHARTGILLIWSRTSLRHSSSNACQFRTNWRPYRYFAFHAREIQVIGAETDAGPRFACLFIDGLTRGTTCDADARYTRARANLLRVSHTLATIRALRRSCLHCSFAFCWPQTL